MPDHNTSRLLKVSASFQSLKDVNLFVKTSVENFGLDQETVYDLVLAVEEAVTNIIKHGYGGGSSDPIVITLEHREGNVMVKITDHSPPFDPTTLPAPDLSVPLLERKIGGMGIFMMKQSVDRVQYQVFPEDRNELVFVKYASAT